MRVAYRGHPSRKASDEEVPLVHAAEQMALRCVGELLDPAATTLDANDRRAIDVYVGRNLDDEAAPVLFDQEYELTQPAIHRDDFDPVGLVTRPHSEPLPPALAFDVELDDVPHSRGTPRQRRRGELERESSGIEAPADCVQGRHASADARRLLALTRGRSPPAVAVSGLYSSSGLTALNAQRMTFIQPKLTLAAASLLVLACATTPPPPPEPAGSCLDGAPELCVREAEEAYRKEQFEEARGLYTAGCAAHDLYACYGRGEMERTGRGGPRDDGRARAAFVRSCDLGGDGACIRAAELAQWGLGGSRDEHEARRRFAAACALGNDDGCHRTAELERMGRGGPKDLATAITHLSALCASGRVTACDAAEATKREKASFDLPSGTPTDEGCAGSKGGLDKDVIMSVIRAHMMEVRYCYNLEMAAGKRSAGTVRTSFVIAASGAVRSAQAEVTGEELGWVGQCVIEQIRTWRFPPPKCGGDVTVDFPFIFKIKE